MKGYIVCTDTWQNKKICKRKECFLERQKNENDNIAIETCQNDKNAHVLSYNFINVKNSHKND